MDKLEVIIDTNVFVSALKSKKGGSHKLLTLIGKGKFNTNISVPLILEYEYAAKRLIGKIKLKTTEINDILNYICRVSNRKKIYFLWRPFLNDPKDDMVLELAVSSKCDMIITFNKRDFKDITKYFGIRVLTPSELLLTIGELS